MKNLITKFVAYLLTIDIGPSSVVYKSGQHDRKLQELERGK